MSAPYGFRPDQLEPQLFAVPLTADASEVCMAAPPAAGETRWHRAAYVVPVLVAEDDPSVLCYLIGQLWRALERSGARWPA